MTRSSTHTIVERLCRPQRLGLFGRHGAGKTSLLAALYREASTGRLPDLRLAAADARTADYLGRQVLALEAGSALPTADDVELRLHLYDGAARVELVVRDYPGEEVGRGREEPIHDFLRDCDALWIGLDAASVATPEGRDRSETEVEGLIEQYLAAAPDRTIGRPAACLFLRSDLAGPAFDGTAVCARTSHALQRHCPGNGSFALTNLVQIADCRLQIADRPESEGEPALSQSAICNLQSAISRGLAAPLTWLTAALRSQDAERLERLFAVGDLDALRRGVQAFVRRYPGTPEARRFSARLAECRRRHRRRRFGALVAAAALLLGLTAAYDAVGYHSAAAFAVDHPEEPAATLARWRDYRTWHPTRLLYPGAAAAEAERLTDLEAQVRRTECDRRQAELLRLVADPRALPEAIWARWEAFRSDFPEALSTAPAAAVQARCDGVLADRARRTLEDLNAEEARGADLTELLARADRAVRDHGGTGHEDTFRARRAAYALRLEEREIEAVRVFSTQKPLDYAARREQYQRYLDRHPQGVFAAEAESALRTIAGDGDRHDFRTVRDLYVARPLDAAALTARCRTYLAVHPDGRFATAARDLLRWTERVTAPADYRVVLKSGSFHKKTARLFSRGPDLSVTIEVAGVQYGPSPIVVNNYAPEWEYEFPRRIRWRLGDPVRVRVTDHDWCDRVVFDLASAADDALGLRLLSGEAALGPNQVVFESDFRLPELPAVE